MSTFKPSWTFEICYCLSLARSAILFDCKLILWLQFWKLITKHMRDWNLKVKLRVFVRWMLELKLKAFGFRVLKVESWGLVTVGRLAWKFQTCKDKLRIGKYHKDDLLVLSTELTYTALWHYDLTEFVSIAKEAHFQNYFSNIISL